MSDLAELIKEHLDHQESVGGHHDWPQALTALRAVLALHKPVPWPKPKPEDDCPGCARIAAGLRRCGGCSDAAGDMHEWPCPTVDELASALGVSVDGKD